MRSLHASSPALEANNGGRAGFEQQPVLQPGRPTLAADTLPQLSRCRLQSLVATTSLSLFNFGYNTASISGALLYIDAENYDCRGERICLTDSFSQGVVVSSVLLGAVVGALLAGSLADRLGRRTVLLGNNFFFIFGPIGMACAPSVEFLVIARFVAGIGVGIASALTHVYISEIVPADRRGEHGAILVMMGTGGILLANLVADILQEQWRIMMGIGALPAILQVVLGPFVMMESPHLLNVRRRSAVSTEALLPAGAYGANGAGLQPVLDGRISDAGWRGLWQGMQSGIASQALLVGIGLQMLQQVSGINVCIYYGPKIFTLANFSNNVSIFLSAVVSFVQMVATLLLARLVDRVGRRPMSFFGLVLMVVSLTSLGASFLLPASDMGIMALGSVMVYRVAFSLSLGPLPYIITAEIFPTSCRAAGVSLCWAMNWAANFAVSLSFLPMLGALGTSGTFFIYAVVCVFAILFIYACVPETSGRTLDEPEDTDVARASASVLGSEAPCLPGSTSSIQQPTQPSASASCQS